MKTNNKIVRIAAGALAAMSVATAISIPTFAATPETMSAQPTASITAQPTAIAAAAAADIEEENGYTLGDDYALTHIIYNDTGIIELRKKFQMGQTLTEINGVPLKEIITFGDTGYVSSIKISKVNGSIYDYRIDVEGCGPKDTFIEGKLEFIDKSKDHYSLSLVSSSFGSHYVRYNSDEPDILTIGWSTCLVGWPL